MAAGLKIVNGDFSIDVSGALEYANEGEKCLRDFGKMLVTDNEGIDNITTYYRYNPSYGSQLKNLSRQTGLKRNSLLNFAKELVYISIRNYLDLQESRNNLSEGEVIVDIKYDVYYDPNNLSTILIPMSLTNGQGQIFNLGEFEERIA